jgi:hypothetical protein
MVQEQDEVIIQVEGGSFFLAHVLDCLLSGEGDCIGQDMY